MKKFLTYSLIFCYLIWTGNFGIFISHTSDVTEHVQAGSNTWHFTNTADYTYSKAESMSITGSILQLEQNTLIHSGKINNATTYNGAYDVVVDGNYAYMTNFLRDSVSILNISNPAAPSLVSEIVGNGGTIRLNGAAGIVKDGNYLYVAAQVDDAVQVIDVTNPAAPTAVGQVLNSPTTRQLNGARGIVKNGNYLFIASDTSDAVNVIDVSTPTSPTYITNRRDTTNLNGARDLKVYGNYLMVAAYNGDRLSVVDVSNPLSLPAVSANITDATNLNGAHQIEISGTHAYISAYLNNSVRVVDISNPLAPTALTNISGGSFALNGARDLVVKGTKLFTTAYTSNAVNIANIANPSSPTYVSHIVHNAANPLLQGADGIFNVGNYFYVASYVSDALEILKLIYDNTSPSVTPVTPYNYGFGTITSLSETLGAGNQGTISYQISKNGGTTWYYWNGSAWTATTGGVANSNSISVINTNITAFNALAGGTGNFSFKAFFTSNGDQKVELDAITVNTQDPPAPGGVSSNLRVWLKSNAGTSTTTNGVTLSTWNDQSGNALHASAVTAPIYRNNTTDNLNFYPTIDFNGTSSYMSNTGLGASSKSSFMVVIPNNTVNASLAGSVPFGVECVDARLNTGTCGLPFAGTVLGSFTLAINDEVVTHAIGASTNWRSAETGASSYNAASPMIIGVNENAGANGTDLYEKGVKIDNYSVNTYQFLSNTNYSLGRSMDAANPFYFGGKIVEVINFSGHLSDNDRKKIESYLAFKYGITLNNGTQNYTASDGSTLMWSTSLAGVYTNNVFGIGRDNDQELAQVESKSVEADSILSMKAEGEGTNISPSFVDIANNEFLSISDNGGGNTWAGTGAPAGYYPLARQWRVQEIGDVGTMQLDFDVDDVDFDVQALSAGTQYYFLYDSNNNNDLSDDTPVAMTNVSGSIWRISGVNLAHLREFTLATEASSNNIPTDISLVPNTLNENVSVGTAVGTLTTTDADTGDSHTYSLVSGTGDDNNGSFSIVGDTLYIQEEPDYEIQATYSIRIQTDDGNGGQYQEAFTVSINDVGESLTSILDFETPGKYSVTSGSWSRTTTNPYEASYSLESNNSGAPNSQSCVQVNHTFTSTGGVDFYYNVSSESGGDFLRFYIDNIEQQNWSGTVAWAQYNSVDVAAGAHTYKWCYTKNGAVNTGTDNAFIDYITFPNRSGDTTAPTISSMSIASGSLLPGGSHTLSIGYSDLESGIDISSDIIELYKWNGSSWGTDISATGLNLGASSVTSTGASYPTNNLTYGKYLYAFQISDNSGNSATTGAVFYIDEPTFTVSTGSIDIGSVNSLSNTFSPTVTVTVETVGAGFDVVLNRTSTLSEGTEIIASWNGSEGYGYQKTPYTGNISTINTDENIGTQSQNINTNGNKNTYTFDIQLGALVPDYQIGGDYSGTLSVGVIFDY